jgi:hypothetical protein
MFALCKPAATTEGQISLTKRINGNGQSSRSYTMLAVYYISA